MGMLEGWNNGAIENYNQNSSLRIFLGPIIPIFQNSIIPDEKP
jgi:hypothetical protein